MKKITILAFAAICSVTVACAACSKDSNDENTSMKQASSQTGSDQSRTFTIDGATFKMIFVEHGTFTMGSSDRNVQFSESPAHKVTLTRDYLMGETEVTEALWNAVMSNGGGSQTLPKTSITWKQAHNFVDKLNEIAHAQNLIGQEEQFILPTEAQWEYAAKGGNKSKGYKYSGSNNINEVAVTRENSGSDSPINVKTKKPNELGLYDMSGNAYEWVDDYGHQYSAEDQVDPHTTSGSGYVKRGGSNYHSFSSEPYLFTTTGRYFYSSTDWTIGFRIALLPSASLTAINSTSIKGNANGYNVYTTSGQQLLANAGSLEGLHKGIYIINRKKVLVK